MGIWFRWISACLIKIEKDVLERAGISKLMLHAVQITKKVTNFWRHCFWWAKFKAHGKVRYQQGAEKLKITCFGHLELQQQSWHSFQLPSPEEEEDSNLIF